MGSPASKRERERERKREREREREGEEGRGRERKRERGGGGRDRAREREREREGRIEREREKERDTERDLGGRAFDDRRFASRKRVEQVAHFLAPLRVEVVQIPPVHTHREIKLSFLSASICATSWRIPASAISNQGLEKDDLVPL